MTTEPSFTRFFKRDRSDILTERGRKRTKVVATIGPASEDTEVLSQLFHVGMNVARLNMSHGYIADHQRRLDLVRSLSTEMERPIAVLADLQGPKIRTGKLKDGKPVELVKGATFTITTANWPEGDEHKVGTTYEGLAEDVSAGNTILINDGRLKLEVVEVCGHDITCTVVIGGQLTDSKGINLPGVNVSAPALSEKDKGDLQWAIENDVDYIALSFVRRAFDVQHVKRRIEEAGKRIPIISKIEREDAVDNIEEILNESDGIMVARGDLGIEINTERLPVVQKHLITRANARGKLVITATQMLESMIENPFPTRAESSDVANAVFDGTDAIMLSGETAVGSFPVEAVAEMNRIAVEAEESPYMPHHILDEARFQEDTFSVAMTGSCAYLAKTLQAAGVILATHNDLKAILLSKRRGSTNTISVTHDPAQWRRQSMYWGTVPLLVKATNDHQDLLDRAIDEAGRHGLVKTGDTLVVLMGTDGARARTLKVVEA